MIWIEQALEMITEIEIARSNYTTIALGNLGELMCRLQGNKNPKHEWVNPWQKYLANKELVPVHPKVAKLFLSLSRDGKIPSWVIPYLDLPAIRAADSKNLS